MSVIFLSGHFSKCIKTMKTRNTSCVKQEAYHPLCSKSSRRGVPTLGYPLVLTFLGGTYLGVPPIYQPRLVPPIQARYPPVQGRYPHPPVKVPQLSKVGTPPHPPSNVGTPCPSKVGTPPGVN